MHASSFIGLLKRRALAAIALAVFASAMPGAQAQQLSPRGLTSIPPSPTLAASAVFPASPPPPTSTPQQATNAATLLSGGDNAAPDLSMSGGMYGQQLFRPGVPLAMPTGFNREYVVAQGDSISVRMWGAYTLDAAQPVDTQGNIFIPNVGPVHVAGVRNAELNTVVSGAVARVYKSNVGVYAALDASQPVKVFVTGLVRAPGQYAGASGESVLGYLSRAGGVDPQRGSYVDVRLMRAGQLRMRFDLYRFLEEGQLDSAQLQDGDAIVVGPRHNAAAVFGDVFNAYAFEFDGEQAEASRIVALARPKPGATHVSIVRMNGLEQVSEYHALDALAGVKVGAGDQLSVVSDRSLGTILVRIDGAQSGTRVLTLPYGAKLDDALQRVRPNPLANLEAVQLFRQSVAKRQKELLDQSLKSLETYALTSRSSTSEESALRGKEAELIMQFVQRARSVQPKGQVVLAGRDGMRTTALEDGDVLFIPERNSVVLVNGEVQFPAAVVYDSHSKVADYIRMAGGANQSADDRRVLVARPSGAVEQASLDDAPHPGDEILVIPKITSKSIEVTRGITQIIYQIAVAARIVFGL